MRYITPGRSAMHYTPLPWDVNANGDVTPPAPGPVVLSAADVIYSPFDFAPGRGPKTLFPNRGPAPLPHMDPMRSGIWQQVPPAATYDNVTVDQIRLHLKHNP